MIVLLVPSVMPAAVREVPSCELSVEPLIEETDLSVRLIPNPPNPPLNCKKPEQPNC